MEQFNILVKEMMVCKGIQDYDVYIEGNSNVGDGYMGEMIFFKIISRKDGKTSNLIMKLAKTDKKLRKATTLEVNFQREIFMFTTVFNTLQRFLSEKNKSSDLHYVPKLFWSSKEYMKEAVVLENLKSVGFEMWRSKERLDREHTMVVVRNFAKWHGTVMAYRDQHPDIFEEWIPQLQDIRYQLVIEMGFVNFTRKYFEQIVELLKMKGYADIAKKYEKHLENLDEIFQPASEIKDRLVITHADCWMNNIMFKFNGDKNRAYDCKFIDFQLSHVNTPIEDLSFFIYSASAESVIDNPEDVLQEYYSILSNTMRSLGSDPHSIFTYSKLLDDWKRYGHFGVISCIELIKLKYFREWEVPDFLKLSENGGHNIGEAFMKPIENEEVYLAEVLKVFISFGNKYL
ncbi:hypothetical protein WA026_001937 [Henosepilachna vigintioctopunctata]|uniref:CHK kinase-like domain-containing protein n=1 Tax=Henosepilachna vigintioctopunctata TaxID=420089 RepID=A0AAW1ULU1_9CUCU